MSISCRSKPGRFAAAALLLAMALLPSCGGDGTGRAGATTSAPLTTTVAPLTTPVPTSLPPTTAPPTNTTTTMAATTTTAALEQPPLLVADADGIRITESDGVVVTFLAGTPATVAFPDLRGGVVFQVPEGPWAWTWDAVADHAAIAVESGPGPSSIYHVAAPGDAPEVLVDAHDARPSIQQVVRLGDHPTLVYRTWVPAEDVDCAPDDPECVSRAIVESLHLLDLETGEDVALGYVGSFESSWVSYVLGPDLMVVLSESYGGLDACGRLAERSELIAEADPSTWIGEVGPSLRSCEFPAHDAACTDCVEQIRAAIAPDEATVAYGMSSLTDDAAVFVVLDASSGDELRRSVVGERWTAPAWVDWDGETAVVGGWLESGPVVLLADGTSQHMPEGSWVVLWKET